jgi:hypothetical protein
MYVCSYMRTLVKLRGEFLQLFAETLPKTCQDRQWPWSNKSEMRRYLSQPVFSEEDGDIKFIQSIPSKTL